MKIIKCILFLLLVTFLLRCMDNPLPLPKPRMYPRVHYPEKSFKDFSYENCGFTFRYPSYANIKTENSIYKDLDQHPCWFNLHIDTLNATLFCSYHSIKKPSDLDKYINDAFLIVNEHNTKANYRRENILDISDNVKGIQFEIEGPVASTTQFYLTDQKKHFFRASLYLNTKVNPDSTAPIIEFLKPDLDTIISSFKWVD